MRFFTSGIATIGSRTTKRPLSTSGGSSKANSSDKGARNTIIWEAVMHTSTNPASASRITQKRSRFTRISRISTAPTCSATSACSMRSPACFKQPNGISTNPSRNATPSHRRILMRCILPICILGTARSTPRSTQSRLLVSRSRLV